MQRQRLVDSLHFGECARCHAESIRLYTWWGKSSCANCIINDDFLDDQEDIDFLVNFESTLDEPDIDWLTGTAHIGKCIGCLDPDTIVYSWVNGTFCAQCIFSSDACLGECSGILREFDDMKRAIRNLYLSVHNGNCDCCGLRTHVYTWPGGQFCGRCLVRGETFGNRDDFDYDDFTEFDEELMREEGHRDAGG